MVCRCHVVDYCIVCLPLHWSSTRIAFSHLCITTITFVYIIDLLLLTLPLNLSTEHNFRSGHTLKVEMLTTAV